MNRALLDPVSFQKEFAARYVKSSGSFFLFGLELRLRSILRDGISNLIQLISRSHPLLVVFTGNFRHSTFHPASLLNKGV